MYGYKRPWKNFWLNEVDAMRNKPMLVPPQIVILTLFWLLVLYCLFQVEKKFLFWLFESNLSFLSWNLDCVFLNLYTVPWKANCGYLSACSYSDKMEEVEWSGSDVSVGCQATLVITIYIVLYLLIQS